MHRLKRGWLRIMVAAGCTALMWYIAMFEWPAVRSWSDWTLPLSGKVIVVDAGHGGEDGGAVSGDRQLIEKQLTLNVSMALRDLLQQMGAVVVMTREGDYDLARPETSSLSRRKTEDLHARAAIVDNSKASMLITIHGNSFPSGRWRGAQTFYNPKLEVNMRLAKLLQEELRSGLGNTDRVAKEETTVFLLRQSPVPTALVEVGFLSNAAEASLLKQTAYQHKLAEAIYRGILRYFTEGIDSQAN